LKEHLEAMIDMPRATVDLLFRFLHQNVGKLSKGACEKEFAALTDKEAQRIEGIYRQAYAE